MLNNLATGFTIEGVKGAIYRQHFSRPMLTRLKRKCDKMIFADDYVVIGQNIHYIGYMSGKLIE